MPDPLLTPHPVLIELPYQRDNAPLMGTMAELPGAVILDSGLSDHTEARFDILSAWPSAVLPESDPTDCVFLACDRLLQRNLGNVDLGTIAHLPFCGGLMGFLAYQAAGHVSPKTTEKHRQGNAADTTDRDNLQSFPRACVGFYHWAIIADHQRGVTECFILPDCPAGIRKQVLELLKLLKRFSGETDSTANDQAAFYLSEPFSAAMDIAQYTVAFDRLKEWILAGDCYQANLAIPFRAGYRGKPHIAYQMLRRVSQSPFSAWMSAKDVSVLSLSPERFVSVRKGKVCTQPIKGTRRRSADHDTDATLQEELRNSEKDRAENLMIVDLLRNDLGSVCETGSVRTESLFSLHSFSHVHHLVSTISGRLPASVTPLTLLKHCYPGGSITGAPKIRAMQIIAELEALPRTIYCGSIFYCDLRGHLDSSICIRTLAASNNRLYCWGGGGIVADSVCDLEYKECHDKVAALMAALPISGHQ